MTNENLLDLFEQIGSTSDFFLGSVLLFFYIFSILFFALFVIVPCHKSAIKYVHSQLIGKLSIIKTYFGRSKSFTISLQYCINLIIFILSHSYSSIDIFVTRIPSIFKDYNGVKHLFICLLLGSKFV